MTKLGFIPKSKGRPPTDKHTIEMLSKRDPKDLTVAQISVRDKFVDGLLMGMTRMDAAMYAGYNRTQARRVGSRIFYEPYVQERFSALREKMEEANLVTRKELILNLKTIAIDDAEASRDRISASALIAKVMGYEAPTKTANLHLIQGGVMLVPVPADPREWEGAAVAAQSRLKENVRQ